MDDKQRWMLFEKRTKVTCYGKKVLTKTITIITVIPHALQESCYIRFCKIYRKTPEKKIELHWKTAFVTSVTPTAKEVKFFISDFLSKCDQCKFGHIYWRNPYRKTSFSCSDAKILPVITQTFCTTRSSQQTCSI